MCGQNTQHFRPTQPTTSSTLERERSQSAPPTPPSQSTNSNNDIPRHENSTSSSHLDARSESILQSVKGNSDHTEVTSFPPPSSLPSQVEFTTASTKKVTHKKTRKIARTQNSANKFPDEKGNLMLSWVKRKLSPEKEADTTCISKSHRSELSS